VIDIKLRLIICQMVLGAGLLLDPANPQHGFGLAIMCFGATGIINNTVKFIKDIRQRKESNDRSTTSGS
jgi:hypothetical protein